MEFFSSGGDNAPVVVWQELKNEGGPKFAYRSKVPGGWLVSVGVNTQVIAGVTFMPDPNHQWETGNN